MQHTEWYGRSDCDEVLTASSLSRTKRGERMETERERQRERERERAVWAVEGGKHHGQEGGRCGGKGGRSAPSFDTWFPGQSQTEFSPRDTETQSGRRQERNDPDGLPSNPQISFASSPSPVSLLPLALFNTVGDAQFVNRESPACPQLPSCLTPKHRRSTSIRGWSKLGASKRGR